MKCAILLALVAFAGATPLSGWFGEGRHQSRQWDGSWEHQDPRKEAFHHQSRQWGDSWEHQDPHKEAVHSVAHKITEEALRDQDDYTREAIKHLQWELQQHPQRWEGYSHGGFGGHYDVRSTEHEPLVTAEAIRQLREDLKHHQLHSGDVVRHLHDTIEAGVDAQITAGHHVPTVSGVHGGVFKKLIDEHTEQEIENQISHHHHWAQQLQQQQHFVNKQKHEIETLLVQHRGTPEQVQRLKEAHHHLQMQEYHLIHEQLAHHLAVLQLQEALVHKEQQILEDTIGEHVHEEAARDDFGRKYWSY